MHLIIFDVVPALLSWEDPDAPAEAVPSAPEVLDRLYPHFRMIAVTDGGRTTAALRHHLEDADLALFFDGISTTTPYGPELSPRVALRVARAAGAGLGQAAVVTGREHLATTLRQAGVPVVFVAAPDGLDMVPMALESLRSGWIIP